MISPKIVKSIDREPEAARPPGGMGSMHDLCRFLMWLNNLSRFQVLSAAATMIGLDRIEPNLLKKSGIQLD